MYSVRFLLQYLIIANNIRIQQTATNTSTGTPTRTPISKYSVKVNTINKTYLWNWEWVEMHRVHKHQSWPCEYHSQQY